MSKCHIVGNLMHWLKFTLIVVSSVSNMIYLCIGACVCVCVFVVSVYVFACVFSLLTFVKSLCIFKV